jgi:hypothetical protein
VSKPSRARVLACSLGAYIEFMVFVCADCDCEFEFGVRITTCNSSTCCCNPELDDSIEALAERVVAAFESADLGAIRELLAPNASWGAPGETPATCQTRDQVMQWYENGYEQGIRATVNESLVIQNHIVLGLDITQLNGNEHDVEDRWQVLTVENALIVDIRAYQSRDGALLAAVTTAAGD